MGSFLQRTQGLFPLPFISNCNHKQEWSENTKEAVKGRKLKVHMSFSVILEAGNICSSLRSCLPRQYLNTKWQNRDIPTSCQGCLKTVFNETAETLLLHITLNCCYKCKGYNFFHWEEGQERPTGKLMNYIWFQFQLVICFKCSTLIEVISSQQ